jgi:hypothetical protein
MHPDREQESGISDQQRRQVLDWGVVGGEWSRVCLLKI